MESTQTTTTKTETSRSPAVSALAVVGFIALILVGMGLAVYAARYIPMALSGMGEAAVSLSRVFTSDDEGSIEVIDQPETPSNPGVVVTIPIGPATPTETAPSPTPAAPAPTPTYPTYVPTPTYGTQVPVIVPIQGQTGAGYGQPDLTVEIMAVGYVTRDGSSSTFRESSRVPRGDQGAVKFRLSNRGTNSSDRYEYEVKVKNDDNRTDTATGRAPSLGAGQSVITYAFFDARTSGDADIDIEVDSGNDVRESNERNNTDSADTTVRD